MRRLASLALAGLLGLPATAGRAEPTVTTLPLGFKVEQMRGAATRVAATVTSTEGFRDMRATLKPPFAVVWGQEGAAALAVEGGSVRVFRAKGQGFDLVALERGRGEIPGARVAGSGGFSAQFEMATRDHPREALGSPVHARVLAITERKPSPPSRDPKPVPQDIGRIAAGEGAVFEDREPHLVDLGSDNPAILAVRSYRDRGSALAVIARREGTWRIVAETPPDGEPDRWLNPVATGQAGPARDIALVRRPHTDGSLQVWRIDGDKLALRAEKAGYSNHVQGKAVQDLAAWFSAEDGSPRIAIPVLDRTALALLSVGEEVKEVTRIVLPAKAASGIAALGTGRDIHFLVGLEDGSVVDVRP